MSQLLIKIVAIHINKFVLESILYGGSHSPNSCFHAFNAHMKSNMPQRLLLFPSNKPKKIEM